MDRNSLVSIIPEAMLTSLLPTDAFLHNATSHTLSLSVYNLPGANTFQAAALYRQQLLCRGLVGPMGAIPLLCRKIAGK